MAENWIKMRENLTNSPKVLSLVRLLSDTRPTTKYEVVGRLHAFWCWVEQHTPNGENLEITVHDVDGIVDCPGFAVALRKVGWLSGRDGALVIPGFEKHMDSCAKARAMEAMAKALRRSTLRNVRPSDEKRDHTSDSLPDRMPSEMPDSESGVSSGSWDARDSDVEAPVSCPTSSPTIVRPEKRREEYKNKKRILLTEYPKRKDAEEVPKDDSQQQQRPDPVPCQAVVEAFNAACPSLPRVRDLTEARRNAIRARWRSGKRLADFEAVFRRAEASDFLAGRSNKWNGASFDWLLKPANWAKIDEGNYDNDRGKHQHHAHQQSLHDRGF